MKFARVLCYPPVKRCFRYRSRWHKKKKWPRRCVHRSMDTCTRMLIDETSGKGVRTSDFGLRPTKPLCTKWQLA
ncbi:hypothetical protein VTN31DRAFT_4673 [Thermomyces dupontii]|uniref:uncharacterized protein n=1 Tax=Talaromyces thermophilus TaxID=28565 RepID=UPI003743F35B